MPDTLVHKRAVPCEILPFPARNRVGHIRRIADRVHSSRTSREANDYRRRAADGLARQMEKAGVAPERIAAELHAFDAGLRAELFRLSYAAGETGGGAA